MKVFMEQNISKNPDYVEIDSSFDRSLRYKYFEMNDYQHSPSFCWEGFLFIPSSGTYSFSTLSFNHSRIYINDYIVVDNSGWHSYKSVQEKTFLTKGVYKLRIEYIPGDVDEIFIFRITGKGFNSKQGIPYAHLFPTQVTSQVFEITKWLKMLSHILLWLWTLLFIYMVTIFMVWLHNWLINMFRPSGQLNPEYISSLEHKLYAGLLLTILAIGLVLRLSGSMWGLPYGTFHVDEPVILGTAFQMLAFDDLNPHRFDWPSLTMYMVYFQNKIFYFLAHDLLGFFRDFFDFEIVALLNFSVPIFISKLLFSLLSYLTIPMVYLVGKELFNEKAGIISAAFIAVDFLHLKISVFVIPDGPMILMLLIALYFGAMILSNESLIYYLLAGIFAGAAAASKYNGGIVVIPLIFAHFYVSRKNNKKFFSKEFLGLGTMAFLTFCIMCPYAMLDFKNFIQNGILYQYFHFKKGKGHGGLIIQHPWTYYFFDLLPRTMGWFVLVCAIISIGWGILKHWYKSVFLILFPLAYGILILKSKLVADRYMVPIIPFLYIFMGAFLTTIFSNSEEWFSARNPVRFHGTIIVLAICCFLGIPSARYAKELFSGNETRIQAKRWIESNIPTGETILVSYENFFSPPLNKIGIMKKKKQYAMLGNIGNPFYEWCVNFGYPGKNVVFDSGDIPEYNLIPWNHVVDLHDTVNFFRSNKYEYVLVSEYRYERYLKKNSHVKSFTRIGMLYKRFYETMDNYYPLIAIFEPSENIWKVHPRWPISPVIKIYRIPKPIPKKVVKKGPPGN